MRSTSVTSKDLILAVIPKHGTFYIEKEVTQGGCGGITTPKQYTELVLGYYVTPDNRKIEFSFPSQYLKTALTKKANSLEDFGPALQEEYRPRYMRVQLASKKVPLELSTEEEAIKRVKTGSPEVQLANLEYLISKGVTSDKVIDLYIKSMESDHLCYEAATGIGLVRNFNRSQIEKLKGVLKRPWLKCQAAKYSILETILRVGLLNENSEDIDYVLGIYSSGYGPDTLTPVMSLALELGDKELIGRAVLGLRNLRSLQARVDLAILYRDFPTDRKKMLLEALGNICKPIPNVFSESIAVRTRAQIPLFVYQEALSSGDPSVRLLALESISSNLHHNTSHQVEKTQEFMPSLEQALTDKD
ncbi:MAG: hypothetical protein KDD62_16295, partial [Bdellovibrionales bacterium]|nr:hypothetical protein [Bdellovibrionales bacterium]